MKNLLMATVVCACVAFPAVSLADLITLQPTPRDLHDLDHWKCYTWGMSIDADPAAVTIDGAVLSFDNIRNWDNRPNQLYVHLLDTAPAGVTVYRDSWGGDSFAGQGIELVTYHNLTTTPRDIDYVFTSAEVDTFNQYLNNGGDVALGFDPDCHYYNDGVSLKLSYNVVPEPASATLILIGAAMVLMRRFRR